MKYLTLLVVVFACLATQAQATMQVPDIITHDGIVYKLHTPTPNKALPLEILWKDHKSRPRLSEGPGGLMSSACWRGYVAIWEVEKSILYLKGLDAWQVDKKADLKSLFPERFKKGRVKADWFSGVLGLSTGRGKSVALVFTKGELTHSPNQKVDHISKGSNTSL